MMFAMLMSMMALCITFVSCGDDEDNIGPGGSGDSGGSVPQEVEAVDLALPSGTLWANMNVGATTPEDYGDYFAWGETDGYKSGKSNFTSYTYKWCYGDFKVLTKYCGESEHGYNGFTDNKSELELLDDAAYVNMGKKWRMPSYNQFKELINNTYTTRELISQNGVPGLKITSKTNGNSIFLPSAAFYDEYGFNDHLGTDYYWTRTLASFHSSYASTFSFEGRYPYKNLIGDMSMFRSRYEGLPVRAVCLSE